MIQLGSFGVAPPKKLENLFLTYQTIPLNNFAKLPTCLGKNVNRLVENDGLHIIP